MKKNILATSIIESIIVILIISIGIVGTYKIYWRSIEFSNSLEKKIQAIQIARQGIELVENIRNTNWILFLSDKKNCWITLNYDSTCIGDDTFGNKIIGNFKSYKDEGRWYLEENPSLVEDYNDLNYRNFYKVSIDPNGIYTQSGGLKLDGNYTRQIKILENPIGSSTGVLVKSIVKWNDKAKNSGNRQIILENIMTNYKR